MPERTLYAMKKCLFGNKLNKKVLKTQEKIEKMPQLKEILPSILKKSPKLKFSVNLYFPSQIAKNAY